MEPLFTTQTAYTFEEYKRFSKRLLLGKKILSHVLMSFLMMLVLIMAVIATQNFKMLYYFLLWLVFILIIEPITQNSALEKAYDSNKALQKSWLYTYSFFNDHLEVRTARSFSSLEYCDILRLIETQTNFYIMTAINQAYIINKSNCSPELIAFIQNLKPQKGSG